MINIDSNFWHATLSFIERLSNTINGKLEEPVKAYLAGDAAFHYYFKEPTSIQLDLSLSHHFVIDPKLSETYSEDGIERTIKFNFNHNPVSELIFHEHQEHAEGIGTFGVQQNLELFVLSPIDLAVSKLSSDGSNSNSDISRLAECGSFDADTFKKYASERIEAYVGNKSALLERLDHACRAIQHSISHR